MKLLSFVELLFVILLVVLADNGRLRHVDTIAKRFSDLTMAHRGEVKAIVTTVIVSLILTFQQSN